MTDVLARLLLELLRPLGLALARWRFSTLDRAQRRLAARLLGRRRYSRRIELYGMPAGVLAPQQLANYVGHSLAAPLTNVATVATWDSVAGWPTTGNFMLRLDDPPPLTTFEYVEVSAVNVGANQTTFLAGAGATTSRGQEDSNAIAHASGTVGANWLTAGMIEREISAKGAYYSADARCSTAQAIGAGTYTLLAIDTLNVAPGLGDPSGSFNLVSHLYTAKIAGSYLLVGYLAQAAIQTLGGYFNVNGAVLRYMPFMSTQRINGSVVAQLAIGDTVGLMIWMTGASTVDNTLIPSLQAIYLG